MGRFARHSSTWRSNANDIRSLSWPVAMVDASYSFRYYRARVNRRQGHGGTIRNATKRHQPIPFHPEPAGCFSTLVCGMDCDRRYSAPPRLPPPRQTNWSNLASKHAALYKVVPCGMQQLQQLHRAVTVSGTIRPIVGCSCITNLHRIHRTVAARRANVNFSCETSDTIGGIAS